MPPVWQLTPMTPADIPAGMRLKEAVGWNQLPADWRRLLDLEPQGCFMAVVDGRPVGTVTTIPYGRSVGWIGMLLVDPAYRGRGYGKALLACAMERLRAAGVATLKLDATPAGRPLYVRFGFGEEYGLTRWEGPAVEMAPAGCRPMHPADLDAVLSLDREAFGCDRARLVLRLAQEFPSEAAVCEGPAGRVQGFVFWRPGATAWHVGPLVACQAEAGRRLLGCALSRLAGQRVLLDVPHPNEAAMAGAAAAGLAGRRQFMRMYNGPDPVRGRPEWVWATADPSAG